jgi:hypothetical protein
MVCDHERLANIRPRFATISAVNARALGEARSRNASRAFSILCSWYTVIPITMITKPRSIIASCMSPRNT